MLGKRLLTRAAKGVAGAFGYDLRRTASNIGNMQYFLRLLRANGLRPTTVLDVGAHTADWSREARAVFPEARFVMIEPQVELQPHLEAFCREAPGTEFKLAGAGRQPGELELTIWPDFAGSSLLAPGDTASHLEKRRVPIITIDSLFPVGKELPQLVKLDIQGFELEALAGATQLFGVTQCFILEVSLFRPVANLPVVADVMKYFDERGYKLYDIPGHMRRPLDNALGQVDLAFVPKSGILDRDQHWDRKDV